MKVATEPEAWIDVWMKTFFWIALKKTSNVSGTKVFLTFTTPDSFATYQTHPSKTHLRPPEAVVRRTDGRTDVLEDRVEGGGRGAEE